MIKLIREISDGRELSCMEASTFSDGMKYLVILDIFAEPLHSQACLSIVSSLSTPVQ